MDIKSYHLLFIITTPISRKFQAFLLEYVMKGLGYYDIFDLLIIKKRRKKEKIGIFESRSYSSDLFSLKTLSPIRSSLSFSLLCLLSIALLIFGFIVSFWFLKFCTKMSKVKHQKQIFTSCFRHGSKQPCLNIDQSQTSISTLPLKKHFHRVACISEPNEHVEVLLSEHPQQ